MPEELFGIHPVLEALRAGRRTVHQVRLLRRSKGRIAELAAEVAAAGIPVIETDRAELQDLVGPNASHQGVVARVSDYPYADLDAVMRPRAALGVVEARDDGADEGAGAPSPLVLVIDSITDPQNLGALLRSAEALGASGAIIPKDRAAPVTPAAVRASAGAAEHLPVAMVTNLRRTLDELKEAGLWIAGAMTDGGVPPWQVDLAGPLALVIGSEEKGIRRLVAEACDYRLTLPLGGAVASLNAGAAGTALLTEIARQRWLAASA